MFFKLISILFKAFISPARQYVMNYELMPNNDRNRKRTNATTDIVNDDSIRKSKSSSSTIIIWLTLMSNHEYVGESVK